MATSSLFGGLSLDSTLKKIYNVLGRLTYDSVGRVRVYADAAVNINASQTLATVTTVTTSNNSIGDTGKNNTAIASSVVMMNSIRGNWKS